MRSPSCSLDASLLWKSSTQVPILLSLYHLLSKPFECIQSLQCHFQSLEAIQAICNVTMFIMATYKFTHGDAPNPVLNSSRSETTAYCVGITILFIFLYSLRTYIFLIVIVQALIFLLKAQKHTDCSRLSVPMNLGQGAENKMLPESKTSIQMSSPSLYIFVGLFISVHFNSFSVVQDP